MVSENCEHELRQEATFVVANLFASAPDGVADRAFEEFPELVTHLMKALPLSNKTPGLLLSLYKSLDNLA